MNGNDIFRWARAVFALLSIVVIWFTKDPSYAVLHASLAAANLTAAAVGWLIERDTH